MAEVVGSIPIGSTPGAPKPSAPCWPRGGQSVFEVAAFEGLVVAVEGALAATDLLGKRSPRFFHGGLGCAVPLDEALDRGARRRLQEQSGVGTDALLEPLGRRPAARTMSSLPASRH
jgi:hypothetical protein